MHPKTHTIPALDHLTSYTAITCPAQVLVIDRSNGPANVLVDTISLLLDRQVSVTSVVEHDDAMRALDCCCFDLIVVGVESRDPGQLPVLAHIQLHSPDLPILVIGRDLPRIYRQYARHHGAREVLNMPDRAADLKALMANIAERYLQAA